LREIFTFSYSKMIHGFRIIITKIEEK